MRDDADRWNARYDGELADEPAPPIGLDTTSLPAGGLCLDVACGLGAQAVWAAMNGFDVVALDISDNAVAATQRFAEEHRVADRVDGRVVDLDDGLPEDLRGECDLVVCQRFRDPELYPRLVEALAPDGMLAITVLSSIGADGDVGQYHAAPGELVVAFADLEVEILSHTEADGIATLIARNPSEG